ncbi:hypothetical protein BD413DRAFT_609128 [Trametes elegans]|nr:hypothetical protein BD413DRAFT_609128 [Trametes elegans]
MSSPVSEARTPALPMDVLLEIASFCPTSTQCTLMRVCRTLYHDCAKSLLRRRIVIDVVSDLVSFIAFLQAEGGDRCQYLRDLVLDLHPPSGTLFATVSLPGPISQSLVDIFTKNTFRSLVSLRLDNAEMLLRSHSHLANGFAHLTSLTSLTITQAGLESIKMVKVLRSHLRVLVLKYEETFDPDVHTAALFHPVLALQKFRRTLETLAIHGFEADLPRNDLCAQFPNMQELILDSPDSPLLAPYIKAFPNLRNLSITTGFADKLTPGNLQVEAEFYEPVRLTNRADQLTTGSWTKLETVTGTVPDIYIAGFTCPIEVLYLNVCKHDPFDMVLSILRDAVVNRLRLFVTPRRAFEEDGLPMVFRGLSHSILELLALNIRLCGDVDEYDERPCIVDTEATNRLLVSLASLSIQKLEIQLRCECVTGKGPHAPRPPSRPCGGENLADFDCEAYARRALATVPAVQSVDVRFMCTFKQRASVERAA